MKKTYYLFNPGRLARKDNTLQYTAYDEQGLPSQVRHLPVHDVVDLYIFGSLDANSALYNFLGKQGISVHFFDYHEHYTGSFMAKEYLLAGKLQVQQTQHYTSRAKRLTLARKFVEGSAFNLLKNLRYYQGRGREVAQEIQQIDGYVAALPFATAVPELMGLEGNIRQTYYGAFDRLVPADYAFGTRTTQPPQNELNALLSFCNMLCYAACLSQIYHTQLNPTISFLHEPGTRRFSLALDLSEIFKPLIVDRAIFRLLNTGQLKPAQHFDKSLDGCYLSEAGKKLFLSALEERLGATIKHRRLGRHVSYRHLIRLECYKLVRHLTHVEPCRAFRAWW